MPCFPFASFRNVTPARVSKWPSVCKSHRVKLTGIRAQPESSSSIRSMMCSALKALSKHRWVQFVKWRLLVWAASSVVLKAKQRPVMEQTLRGTRCVSGLCWADLRGTGGAGLRRMRAYAWMFLPFLEEAHCLWHSNSRYIRSCKRSEQVCTSFISRPLRMFEWATIVTVGNKFSAALGRSCQFPQSCPQMRSSTPLSHQA